MNKKSNKNFTERVLSGIQPTGKLHVGNYLGMLQNAVAMQEQFDRPLYSIVDLHSLTTDYEPDEKREQILNLALDMFAAGIDPEKSVVFKQSDVLEHANLGWILNTLTYMGELERMTQFKEKSEKQKDNINIGLFDYPVLQTADILLYKATHVPVGEDQTQHIELARDIAKRFNNRFEEIFPVPKAVYTKAPRVMSLLEPDKKMAKTLGDNHCIYLTDEPKTIKKKLSKAVTATNAEKNEMPAGVKNLFLLLENFGTQEEFDQFKSAYKDGSIQYGELKQALAEAIAEFFAPFRKKRKQLESEPKKIQKLLDHGAKTAQHLAHKTLEEVKETIGLK